MASHSPFNLVAHCDGLLKQYTKADTHVSTHQFATVTPILRQTAFANPPLSSISSGSTTHSSSFSVQPSVRFLEVPHPRRSPSCGKSAERASRRPATRSSSPLSNCITSPKLRSPPSTSDTCPYLSLLEGYLAGPPSVVAKPISKSPQTLFTPNRKRLSYTTEGSSLAPRSAPTPARSPLPTGTTMAPYLMDCSMLPPLPRRRPNDPLPRQRYECESQEELVNYLNERLRKTAPSPGVRSTSGLFDWGITDGRTKESMIEQWSPCAPRPVSPLTPSFPCSSFVQPVKPRIQLLFPTIEVQDPAPLSAREEPELNALIAPAQVQAVQTTECAGQVAPQTSQGPASGQPDPFEILLESATVSRDEIGALLKKRGISSPMVRRHTHRAQAIARKLCPRRR